MQRNRHRGIARDVRDDAGESHELTRPTQPREWIGVGTEHLADVRRRLRERRCEPHVEVLEELRNVARIRTQRLEPHQIVGGFHRSALFPEAACQWLEFVVTRFATELANPVGHDPRHSGAERRADRFTDRGCDRRKPALFDDVPELLAQPDRVLEHADAVGVGGMSVGGYGGVRDAQTTRGRADFVDERSRTRRRGERVAELGAGDHVEDGRAVAHRTGERVLDGHCTDGVAVLRTHRHSGTGGLEPEQRAARRGIANRSAEIIGVRGRHHAGGHSRGGSAARPRCRVLACSTG